MVYDLSVLNDKEFENLVADLFSEKMNLLFHTYKKGRDKGIDARVSSQDKNNKIVLQAKHYFGSKYSHLKYHIVNVELSKIKSLAPARYILVTSVALSPSQQEELKEILKPFVISLDDIVGKDTLLRMIDECQKIVKRHYKLWFTGIPLIESVVNNDLIGRSSSKLQEIRYNLKYYVDYPKRMNVVDILNRHRVAVITGPPGVGKTTLANMICFELSLKEYEFVYMQDIKDGERMISSNKDDKQVFLFDDFLGSNYLELRNKDASPILDFVGRVERTKNKFLLMTVRTTILNQALGKDEKLKNFDLEKKKYEVSIDAYDKTDKAKMLYNYLFHSSISYAQFSSVAQGRSYEEIIEHKNFNPRLLVLVLANFVKIEGVDNLCKHFIDSFDSPSDVWELAISSNLSEAEQWLLQSCFSFHRPLVSKVEEVYNKRLEYHVEKFNYIRKDDLFMDVLRRITGTYLTIVRASADELYVDLANPSLVDHLVDYFNKYKEAKLALIKSFLFFDQLYRLCGSKNAFKGVLIESQNECQSIFQFFCENINECNYHSLSKVVEVLPYDLSRKILTLYLHDVYDADDFNSRFIFLFRHHTFARFYSFYERIGEGFLQAAQDNFFYYVSNVDELSELRICFDNLDLEWSSFIEHDDIGPEIEKIINHEVRRLVEEESDEVSSLEDFEQLQYKVEEKGRSLMGKYLEDEFLFRADGFLDDVNWCEEEESDEEFLTYGNNVNDEKFDNEKVDEIERLFFVCEEEFLMQRKKSEECNQL